MKKILISLVFFCCVSLAFGEVKLQVESNKVQLGETFALTLSLEGLSNRVVPDFSPLQKDFTITGTESNLNYSIVNGKPHSVSEWTVLLTPKKSGILLIPALKVGVETTKPTSIEVTQTAVTTSQNESDEVGQVKEQAKDILLFTEVTVQEPYVNQQVIYTVKLYNSGRLLDANYQPPQVDDALFVPFGNGQRYQVNKNGRLYTVEEQQFALFPQKSGTLTINPPSFTGLIYDFQPRREKVKAKPTVLQVKPIPSQYQGKWLPAKQVTLSESYDKSTATLSEGATLVRTVALEAVAVPAQLLPKLDFGSSPEFSLYPENPSDNNVFKQQDLVGTKTIKVTYLLNKAGTVTIPPLSVPWFNVLTGKEELSSLPGFTINVIPTTSEAKKQETPPPVSTTTKPQGMRQGSVPKQVTPVKAPPNHLAWWLAGGFALAWLVTIALWVWQKNKKDSPRLQKNVLLKQLREACSVNDPKAAKNALIRWGAFEWPHARILNLIDLENLLKDVELKQEIHQLANRLYSDKRIVDQWHGEALWQCIQKTKSDAIKNRDINPLPPIHRIS